MGRTPAFAFVSLLMAAVMAGCSSPPAAEPLGAIQIPVDQVLAPDALIEPVGMGVRVLWEGPLVKEDKFRVTFPAGVTRIDAMFVNATPTSAATVAMDHEPSGRVRCQPEHQFDWQTGIQGTARCSGLAVLDPAPTTWSVRRTVLAKDERIELLLSSEPLDGQAGLIKLENLAMPKFAERPTDIVEVPASADGEPLHVEITRPDTDGKVPTIIVSSPYNHATRLAERRPQNDTIADFVPRGYAVVSADVRGFGNSGGCVEVWGPNEQQDQVDLVEWVAQQPWSDGQVGFYGQSYVGTTPVAAASLAAPHLTTIITIAPVINAYEDWHQGGVPNGENLLSPTAGYQTADTLSSVLGADLVRAAEQSQRGFCDPTLGIRANDPRAIYDPFYEERDFKQRVRDVQASVFYTQGFIDSNVKPSMVPGWFNELQAPKKGLFGDWVHQHPPRADQELLFHAWFDHWLQGRDTGIMDTPTVEVRTNVDTIRTDSAWPPLVAVPALRGLDFDGGALLNDAEGSGQARLALHAAAGAVNNDALPDRVRLATAELDRRVYVAGESFVNLRATLAGAQNMYLLAALYDQAPDGTLSQVSYGGLNAALRNGYDSYEPVPPGEAIDYRLPLLPTEWVFEPGHKIVLLVRGSAPGDNLWVPSAEPGVVTIEGMESNLELPSLDNPGDVRAPLSAGPYQVRGASD